MKSKTLRFGFFGIALVLMAVGAFALSLQAHAAAPSPATTTTVHAIIIKTTNGFEFKRTTITMSIKNTFDFTNDTAVTQVVTSGGKDAATILAHASIAHTFKKVGTYTFSLQSNPAAVLTVTVH